MRVNATYTKFISAESKYGEGTYILSYGYGGWLYQSRLPSLPGHHKVGDQLCAEIDATQPEHVRIRGTQGAYYGAITRFVGLAGLVAFLVLLIIVAARAPAWRRKRTAS